MHVDAVMGHDLSFPFNIVKRGRRAVYAPDARATEKMVPSIEGEGARKRRMMSHAWAIVLRGGMLDPRGYPPLYALMILSHRVLRYASPLLHLAVGGGDARAAARAARSTARPRSRRPACSPPRRPAAACGCARSLRRALLRRDDRLARGAASTTTCATARPPAGRPPEGTR